MALNVSDIELNRVGGNSNSPPPRTSTEFVSNLAGQGSFTQGDQPDLPSYFPFRQNTIIPRPKQSTYRTLFHGWKYAFGSWLNLLLFLMPASWATSIMMKSSRGVTFSLCILALIPLVRLHDISTRELASRIGGSKTGLLNGSMSNFVEIVVAISALRKCELRVVQSMRNLCLSFLSPHYALQFLIAAFLVVGSMLSKILLVLGLCFFAGGMKFSEQGFDPTATQIHSSLLSLSVGAVLLPAAYHFMLGGTASVEMQRTTILKMSHAVSIVLLFIYFAYLLFQLWSHRHLYRDRHNRSDRLSTTIRENKLRSGTRIPKSYPFTRMDTLIPESTGISNEGVLNPSRAFTPSPGFRNTCANPTTHSSEIDSSVRLVHPGLGGVPMSRESTYGGNASATTLLVAETNRCHGHSDAKFLPRQRKPQMSWFLTISLLVIVTGVVAVTVDLLVAAMNEISTTISKEWVGLILLPTISSVAECITAVKVSVKDELTLSVSVAVGSTIQIALFVIPLTVILAWITKKPLSLLMDPFQSLVLYISVNTMSYVVADGKSNWLEGFILICLYVIVAVSFWFYPGSDLLNSLATCTVA